ncbi:carbon-nitrogen hydrolase family protein [Sporomusa malonica]|uniref:Carbon-nitrogen hydrolase n=1 Tax=Sporomusa malonica TaxID=112901 RepID=A0A1W2E3R0_9FIRM|nr:carbon-nitrogen hydrolase family protein [Sporomusa malonica]SMD04107.1 Carbon-nitrogen hydrolase [Sporomusa malonica]
MKIGIAAVSTTLEQYIPVVTNKDQQQVSDTIQRYTRDIELLAQSGAEVILLPEKVLTLHDQYNILQHLSTTARQNKIHVIVGLNNRDNARFYNSAYVFAPNGELLLKYDKQHLLPAYEGKYTSGDTLGLVKTSAMGIWGIEICKNMDFLQTALTYSQQEINMPLIHCQKRIGCS